MNQTMEDRRRSSGSWEQQGWSGSKPARRGRPPCSPGHSYSSIPSWEKRFCSSVCSVPWKKICEIKGVMSLYKNVAEWNDSAALDAFHNAKARFWAEINGITCNIPMPDPNMYIDKVDYYAVIDPELVADLDKGPPAKVQETSNTTNGWDSFIFMDKPVPATGWGDTEDLVTPSNNAAEHQSVDWGIYKDKPIVPTGWGDEEYSISQNNTAGARHSYDWGIMGGSNNKWNFSGGNSHFAKGWSYSAGWERGMQNDSWGSGWDDSRDNGKNMSLGHKRDNSYSCFDDTNNESGRRIGRKRDGGGHLGYRSTKSGQQVDNYQTSNKWVDGNRSDRPRYSYEKMYSKEPLAIR